VCDAMETLVNLSGTYPSDAVICELDLKKKLRQRVCHCTRSDKKSEARNLIVGWLEKGRGLQDVDERSLTTCFLSSGYGH
jgi:hypothetical protein